MNLKKWANLLQNSAMRKWCLLQLYERRKIAQHMRVAALYHTRKVNQLHLSTWLVSANAKPYKLKLRLGFNIFISIRIGSNTGGIDKQVSLIQLKC